MIATAPRVPNRHTLSLHSGIPRKLRKLGRDVLASSLCSQARTNKAITVRSLRLLLSPCPTLPRSHPVRRTADTFPESYRLHSNNISFNLYRLLIFKFQKYAPFPPFPYRRAYPLPPSFPRFRGATFALVALSTCIMYD